MMGMGNACSHKKEQRVRNLRTSNTTKLGGNNDE